MNECYECGDTAAYTNSIGQELCPGCAADQAADGDIINRQEAP